MLELLGGAGERSVRLNSHEGSIRTNQAGGHEVRAGFGLQEPACHAWSALHRVSRRSQPGQIDEGKGNLEDPCRLMIGYDSLRMQLVFTLSNSTHLPSRPESESKVERLDRVLSICERLVAAEMRSTVVSNAGNVWTLRKW